MSPSTPTAPTESASPVPSTAVRHRRPTTRPSPPVPAPVAGHRREHGQATAEYALVLLGAAVVAVALITWATGSGRIGGLFDAVFDELQSRL